MPRLLVFAILLTSATALAEVPVPLMGPGCDDDGVGGDAPAGDRRAPSVAIGRRGDAGGMAQQPLPGLEAARAAGQQARVLETGAQPGPGQQPRCGEQVEAGQPLLLISPAEKQTWEALRALYLLGDLEVLPLVERFAQGGDAESARIRQQAAATAQAIRRRAQSQQEN